MSRYNGKLYRDIAVLGVQFGWGKLCRNTMNCIMTGGCLAGEWVTIQSLYRDRRAWVGRWVNRVTIQKLYRDMGQ